jgi:hypothetical protein
MISAGSLHCEEHDELDPTASLGRHAFASEHHAHPFIDVQLSHDLFALHFDLYCDSNPSLYSDEKYIQSTSRKRPIIKYSSFIYLSIYLLETVIFAAYM